MTIFVELSAVVANNYTSKTDVKPKVKELLEELNDNNDVVLISNRKESERYDLEEFLRNNHICCDDLLLRGEYDFSSKSELYETMILDHFNGNLRKALDKTLLIMVNDENTIEGLRELGFEVLSNEWR